MRRNQAASSAPTIPVNYSGGCGRSLSERPHRRAVCGPKAGGWMWYPPMSLAQGPGSANGPWGQFQGEPSSGKQLGGGGKRPPLCSEPILPPQKGDYVKPNKTAKTNPRVKFSGGGKIQANRRGGQQLGEGQRHGGGGSVGIWSLEKNRYIIRSAIAQL